MDIYAHPTFEMACQQFDLVADRLDIPLNDRDRLKYPKRSMTVALPIRRDDGSVQVFSGFRVQHHLTLGPTKGGLRYHPDVTLGEVAALAMWMSWKCALTGLPYGGAKGGITCNPNQMSAAELERLTRRYTQEMIPFIGPQVDVMAPDVGTNEQVMAWMMDTYSAYMGHTVPSIVTGKPVGLGGSVGRREATGRGVAIATAAAMLALGGKLAGATAIVQGFGNVGSATALLLAERGVRVIGIADVHGGLHNPDGIDVAALTAYFARQRKLAGFPGAKAVDRHELLTMPCDILVPAAAGNQITKDNAARIQAKLVAEGANSPTTPEADAILCQRGVLVIPDILCNAGGVFVSYLEYTQETQQEQMTQQEVLSRLGQRMTEKFQQVSALAAAKGFHLRDAAMYQAVKTVCTAVAARGNLP